MMHLLLTPTDGSRMSIAIIRTASVIRSVCLSVCPHDIKTKTAETKKTKLSTGIVRHDTSPIDEH